jgi:hypothetical protein
MHQLFDELYGQLEFDFELDLPEDNDFGRSLNQPQVCKKCREIYPYAESNQKDGTFKCYSCRLWE